MSLDHAHFALLVAPRGPALPHERPSDRELALVIAAVTAAWTRVRAEAGFEQLDEDQTTILLHEHLHALQNDESLGFFTEYFSVHRDAKKVGWDGGDERRGDVDKMPDLTIGLHARRPTGQRSPAGYCIEVECKPVNMSVGLKPYYGPSRLRRARTRRR